MIAKPKDVGAAFEAALKRSEDRSGRPAFVLRLFVAGTTAQSTRAIVQLKDFCEAHLKDRYHLEVVDIYQQPALAKAEQIVAVPTLIRKLPLPLRRLIGDLSSEERVLVGLELQASSMRPPEQRRHAKKTRRKGSPPR